MIVPEQFCAWAGMVNEERTNTMAQRAFIRILHYLLMGQVCIGPVKMRLSACGPTAISPRMVKWRKITATTDVVRDAELAGIPSRASSTWLDCLTSGWP